MYSLKMIDLKIISKLLEEKWFLLIFLISSPILDLANGFFVKNTVHLISPGIIIRTFFMVYMILTLIKYRSKGLIFISVISGFFILSVLYNFNVRPESIRLKVDLIEISKYLYTLIIFQWGIVNFRKYPIELDVMFKWILLSTSLYAISINISAIFGLGYTTYSAGGVKSFFVSQNTVSNILTFNIILANIQFFKDKKISSAVILLNSIIAMLLLGTKTAIILAIAVPTVTLFINIIKKVKSIKLRILYVIFIIVSFILILFLLSSKIETVSRFIYFYNKKGLLYMVFSGRSTALPTILSILKQESVISIFLGKTFGPGIELLRNSGGETIEQDFLTLFYQYGIVPFLGYLLICLRSVISSINLFRTNSSLTVVGVIIGLVLLEGILAGHVFNTTAGGYFAIMCAFSIVTQKRQVNNKMESSNESNLVSSY